MAFLLSPKFWVSCVVLALLAFTHGFAYKAGRAMVANDWAQEREARANDLVEQSRAYRAKEQVLVQKANDVDKKLQREKQAAAAAARDSAGELRLLQEALAAASDRPTSDSASVSRAHGAGTGELLLECAGKYQGVAAEADSLAVKLTGLQSYVSGVCKSP
jgi:hypothetical protein